MSGRDIRRQKGSLAAVDNADGVSGEVPVGRALNHP